MSNTAKIMAKGLNMEGKQMKLGNELIIAALAIVLVACAPDQNQEMISAPTTEEQTISPNLLQFDEDIVLFGNQPTITLNPTQTPTQTP